MFPADRVAPGPGQESVWDYPRPPRLEPVSARLRVMFSGKLIADSTRGYRVLETSHPPVYYIPLDDILRGAMEAERGQSWCEFKGHASYWSIQVGNDRSANAAWSYQDPSPAFDLIAGHLAFYASRVSDCYVGDERVRPQDGDFYGGWITSRIVGPFKGGAGTRGW